jgi:hypothetical protein
MQLVFALFLIIGGILLGRFFIEDLDSYINSTEVESLSQINMDAGRSSGTPQVGPHSFFIQLPQNGYCNTVYGDSPVIYRHVVYDGRTSFKTLFIDSPRRLKYKWADEIYADDWIALKNYKGNVSYRLSLEEQAKLWQENGVFDRYPECSTVEDQKDSPACCKDYLIQTCILSADTRTKGE